MEKKREDLKKENWFLFTSHKRGETIASYSPFSNDLTTENWKFPIVRLRHPIVGYALQSPFPVDL